MFRLSNVQKVILLVCIISLIALPICVEAHGGGMGGMSSGMGMSNGMGGMSSGMGSYNYGMYSGYNQLYSPSAGRITSALYPGYGYSSYPNVLGGYSSPYNYGYGNPLGYSLGGYGGYPYGLGSSLSGYGSLYNNPYLGYQGTQVTGKDYTVSQSYTQYLPGGEITTTLGETTNTVTNPFYNPLTNYLSPYSYGYGGYGSLSPSSYGYGGYGSLSPYNYGYGGSLGGYGNTLFGSYI